MNSIVIAGLMVSNCALVANGILAFLPTVVKESAVLGTRIYVVRWCEWVPTAGLMTLMADIVSSTRQRGLFVPCLVGLGQLLSTFAGMCLAYTESRFIWSVMLLFAIVLYASLYPRLWYKYKILRDTDWDTYDIEIHERHRFGFQLLALCLIVWTILVVMFFVNLIAVRTLPESHAFRHEAFPMFVDGTFDVVAKGLFTRLIIDIHYASFTKQRYT